MLRVLTVIWERLQSAGRQRSAHMVCPLINSPCVEAECALWAENQCAIVALAMHFLAIPTPAQTATTDPKEILERCAAMLGRASITSLRRREIDDFLASSHIALDTAQRRMLFRTWRDTRRLARERYMGDPSEWRAQQSNRGNPWSDEEDAELKRSYAAGSSVERIAASHKRSVGAIRSRFEKHGLLSDEDKKQ